MSPETTILRAYALASQGKLVEAELVLKSEPVCLQTPHGLDLLARILYASGQKDSAKHIWKELERVSPDYEAARNALSTNMVQIGSEPIGRDSSFRKKAGLAVAVVAIALGCAFSIGKACHRCSLDLNREQSVVIDEVVIPGKLDGAMFITLKEGFLTNLTDNTVLVLRGGQGKYANDRQNYLANVADGLNLVAQIPLTKLYFQPAEKSTDSITLQVVSDFARKGKVSK